MRIAVVAVVVTASLTAFAPAQADPPAESSCKAVLEVTESEDSSSVRLTLNNLSSVDRVSMVTVALDPSAFPVELVTPEGWTGSAETCPSEALACSVRWHARVSLAPGAAVSGFAIHARDGAVARVLGTSLRVGNCVIGQVQGGPPANPPPM